MQMKDATRLKKDMPILEIAEKSPKAVELLAMYGLHCTNCFFNNSETLEDGARLHGMTDKETDLMVEEINRELEKDT
ncbi:DUF1858 domain-containing protein [Candidatus Daviesbacteria bacterium]|nr:DUF1858 domain-containing protein [Candidatus Daviesbacteria bacterium]